MMRKWEDADSCTSLEVKAMAEAALAELSDGIEFVIYVTGDTLMVGAEDAETGRSDIYECKIVSSNLPPAEAEMLSAPAPVNAGSPS